eukprot:scaffold10934_cov71-Phaeocystis_antarctica.AAC.1
MPEGRRRAPTEARVSRRRRRCRRPAARPARLRARRSIRRRGVPRCHAAAAAAAAAAVAAAAAGFRRVGLGRVGLRRVGGAPEEERAVLEAAEQPRVESLGGEEREELRGDAARIEAPLTLPKEGG